MPVSIRIHLLALLTAALLSLCSCSPRGSTANSDALNRPLLLRVVDSPSPDSMKMEGHLEADFTARTGIAVKSVVASQRTYSSLDQELEWSKTAAAPDIFFIDNVWTALFADNLLDLTPYVSSAERAQWIPAVLSSYIVKGKLVALPRETNFPLLYYRTDLLARYGFKAPPETWDQLTDMALKIQTGERARGNKNFWGWAWEGAEAEALTCAGQEMQISSGGGHLVESDGTINVDNPRAVAAFTRAVSWINRISPPGTSAYVEEDVRNLWDAGNAAFARNWAEGYAPIQAEGSPLQGKVAVTVLPHDPGYPSASTVGGAGYGVFIKSQHPQEAVRLLRFLTNRQAAIWRLERFSELPAFTALYQDSTLASSLAFLKPFEAALFRSASPRPSALTGSHYQEVSKAYSKALHSILCKRQSAAEALRRLQFELTALTGLPSANPR